jgi:hypothetical protein
MKSANRTLFVKKKLSNAGGCGRDCGSCVAPFLPASIRRVLRCQINVALCGVAWGRPAVNVFHGSLVLVDNLSAKNFYLVMYSRRQKFGGRPMNF